MEKDRSERKSYRRSPGRQYGYDYDPLRDGSGLNQGTQGERVTHEAVPQRNSTQLVQRPNLRRTRQLTRKSILASKGRSLTEGEEQEELLAQEEVYEGRRSIEDEADDALSYRGRPMRSGNVAEPHLPSTRQLMETDDEQYEEEGEWEDYQEIDPDAGYEDPDPLDVRMGYAEMPPSRSATLSPRASIRTRNLEPEDYEDNYEDVYEDEYVPQVRRRSGNNKNRVSRRKLLFGLGATAVGGVAAYELVPKIPGAMSGAATNIEHQLEDAFNKGVAQGADTARKELLTALQSLEGFTLDGAINAAKLTRVAYDVFVSPIVKFGSAVTGDFLNGMVRAIKTARGWLAGAYMDNPTLQAVQHVLESWVTQVSNLPKQLDAITDTDLDGAQMYLKALEQKIKDEQAKLNKSGSSTPAPKSK